MYPIKTKYPFDYSSAIWSCLYFQDKTNGKERTPEGPPNKYPWLGVSLTYFNPDQETEIPRGSTIDVYKFSPGFMLKMNLAFFNVETIPGFTSTFVAIWSDTS